MPHKYVRNRWAIAPEGEFRGTYSVLLRKAQKLGGTMHLTVPVEKETQLYVDPKGVIYGPSSASGRLTVVVGQCEELPL